MHSIYFGDIHNHNGLGYGKGSLERTIDIAKEHLDFLAFTGHSSWHDMRAMEGGREMTWVRGFEKLRDAWPEVVRLTKEANQDPDFVAFLGFEWHSSGYGDQCVIFPGDEGEIARPNNLEELRAFCLEHGALMIPHHLAYPTGHRGVNWDVFDPACTPFVEIYSEHGNSEEDRGAFPFFNHSLGGRVTSNTVRSALDRGLRFGFSASSDNHRGFPGGYGEGVTAILADRLSRPALMEAMCERRMYALTGERIELDFSVEGAPMGSDVTAEGAVRVAFDVSARDEIDVVEVIHDGRIAHRAFTQHATPPSGPLQQRIEWGWGPWLDLDLDRVADWHFQVSVEGGRIGRVFPCLQSGPFDEDRRHRVRRADPSRIEIRSYTSRRGAYRGNPNQSVVFELLETEETKVRVEVQAPGRVAESFSIGDLREGGRMIFTGPYPAEAVLVHRPVTAADSRVSGEAVLQLPDHPSYAYLRVRQKNGQTAWSSPVFLNYGS
jgi:hypothetical protein